MTPRTCFLLAAALVTFIVGAGRVRAQAPTATFDHVRGADATAKSLLAQGAARSTAFRGLIDALQHGDVLVYVQTRPSNLPGQLQLVAVTGDCRIVRISIRIPGNDRDLIAWLGHELQHAVEIARAPEVRDQATLSSFYQRIGLGGLHVESAEAQEVQKRVLDELWSPTGVGRRTGSGFRPET
jgi:hypothetical protein